MKRNALSFLLTLLFTSLVFAQTVNSDKQSKEVKFENLNVSMVLVKKQPNGTSTKINWTEEPVNLLSETVPVNGKTINELLRKNNISPDVEAFGIVYALNPEIKKLNKIETAQLKIPKIRGGESLQNLFNQGAVVFLTVDKEVKKQFSEEVKALNGFVEKLKALDNEKFLDANTKTSVLDALGTVANALKGINMRITQRTGRFVPTKVVKQLSAQTRLLNANINAAISSNEKIGKQELEKITDVKEDVEIKVKIFTEVAAGEAPARYPEVSVLVKTLRNGQEVPNLRIYYVPKALRNNPNEASSFGQLSSPANQWLPEANYCFWGANDSTGAVVTNMHCQSILDGRGTIQIQLTVKP